MEALSQLLLALLLVFTCGCGAAEHTSGEMAIELVQHERPVGRQRHLLQAPDESAQGGKGGQGGPEDESAQGGKGGKGGKGGPDAEERAAAETAGKVSADLSANNTNATVPTPDRLLQINCEVKYSKAEQKLMKIDGKRQPLTQKIAAAKVSFNNARNKYHKVRGKAADKQRRNFANEYLATRKESSRIKARDVDDRNYKDKYVILYHVFNKQKDVVPLRDEQISNKKKKLEELLKHEEQTKKDIVTGQRRAKAVLNEIPLKMQEISQAYTRRIIGGRKQDYLLALKEAKTYDADAEMEKALKPLKTMLIPMNKKVESSKSEIKTLNATTTHHQIDIINSQRQVISDETIIDMKVANQKKELQANQVKGLAKTKARGAAQEIREEADKEAMEKTEVATKAGEMARLEAEMQKKRDASSALTLAQRENRKLMLQVAEKVTAASSAATTAENYKATVVSAEKKVWAEKLSILKAQNGESPADKTALEAALKAQKELKSAQKKIMASMPADPDAPTAKQAEKKKKDEQASKSKDTAKATAQVEKAAEQKAKDPLAKKP